MAFIIEVENKYDAILKHAELKKLQNANPKRRPYDLLTNSCIHFVKEITEKLKFPHLGWWIPDQIRILVNLEMISPIWIIKITFL